MLFHLVEEVVIDTTDYAFLEWELLLYLPQLSELSHHLELGEYVLWKIFVKSTSRSRK